MSEKRKRGRPPKGAVVMTKAIKLRLDDDLVVKLKQTGRPMADVIRDAVREYFTKRETKHDENEVSDD